MKRDHSDIDIVNEALQHDEDRHRPPHYGWLVVVVLASWFLILVTWSLAMKTWEVFRG
jgi:hypothetical protein